jgi:hypothetical protein
MIEKKYFPLPRTLTPVIARVSEIQLVALKAALEIRNNSQNWQPECLRISAFGYLNYLESMNMISLMSSYWLMDKGFS